MPSTVPPTPAAAGRTPVTAGNVVSPDNKLLALMQFRFVKHARISDLHQSLNNIYSDTIDAEQDINALFTDANRPDVKNDADLTRAAHRLF